MNAEEVLSLINPDDLTFLTQKIRNDLKRGGPCIFGMTLENGYVTSVIVQTENECTEPFIVLNDIYQAINEYTYGTRTIEIVRALPNSLSKRQPK